MSSPAATATPTAISAPPAHFGWYELMTTDTAAGGAFYSKVVGWTTREVGAPPMPYTTFELNGVGMAGMMTLPKDAGPMPAWIGYIHVPDVDACADRVVAAGGKLHKGPTDVPGMLRFAVMLDPQGAPFVLFTADPRMPSPTRPAPGTPGTIGWHELMAADGDSAFDFYSSQFGWTKGEAHDMGPMGLYQIFDVNGVPTGGIMTKPPQVPAPFWSYYFQVDGIKAAIERIQAGGGTVMNGPLQVPGGSWIVQGTDPQGAFFSLVSATE
jgi:predicted enzyme related to lactoylglutathione lyase